MEDVPSVSEFGRLEIEQFYYPFHFGMHFEQANQLTIDAI